MKIKKMRGQGLWAVLLVFMIMVNLLSVSNSGKSSAHTNNWVDGDAVKKNNITFQKKVVNYNPETKEFDVEISIDNTADKEKQEKTLDAVLLLQGHEGRSIFSIAWNVDKFIKDLIPISGNGKIRLGVVTLGTDNTHVDFTNDVDKISSAIHSVKEGGSYTEEGLKIADEMLKNSAADEKVIIVAGDDESFYSYIKYENFDIKKKVEPTKVDFYHYAMSDLLFEMVKPQDATGIFEGTVYDYLSDYVELANGADTFVESKTYKMDDQGKPVELNGSFGISKVNPNGKSIKVHGVKVRRNEILKIKYSLRLKDEWNDGNKYPVSSNTNIITTKKFNLASGLNGNKIDLNIPKIWENPSTRRLTIEQNWFEDGGYMHNTRIKITSSAGYEKIIEPKESGIEKINLQLPVYDNSGNLIKYTVTEEYLGERAGKYTTNVQVRPDKKNDDKESISFTFDKVGNKIPSRKVIFNNIQLKEETIKVRKTWEGHDSSTMPKEVKFELFPEVYNSKGEIVKGEPIEKLTLTAQNASEDKPNVWEGKFDAKLPMYKIVNDGRESLTYNVEEIGDDGKAVSYLNKDNNGSSSIKDGFVKLGGNLYKVKKTSPNGDKHNEPYNFTNTLVSDKDSKRDIEITHKWIGEKGNVSFGLFKKGESKKLSNTYKTNDEDDNTVVKFENIDILDKDGNVVEYEIKEIDANGKALNDGDIIVLNGKRYKVMYDLAGNITNAETIDITVKKVWGENVPSSLRKSVVITVSNNDDVNTVVLSEAKKWKHTFKDLPKLDDGNGYFVQENGINSLDTNNEMMNIYNNDGLFNVEIKDDFVNETKEVVIKNQLFVPDFCLKVIKIWEPHVKKQEATVKSFTKEGGKWIPVRTGTAPGEKEIEEVEDISDCVIVKPGVPSPASLPKKIEPIFADTLTFGKEVGKVYSMSNKRVLEGAPLADNEKKKVAILETAVGGVELTDDEIQKILNSDNLDVIKYKLGEYDVTVNKITDNMFIINNSGKKIPEKPGKTTPGAITPEVPTTPVTPTPSNPTTPVTPTPSNPTTPVNPTPSNPTTPVNPTPSNPTVPVTPTPSNPTVPVTPVPPTPTVTTPTIPSYPISNTPNPNDPNSPDEFVAVGNDGTPQGKFIKKTKPNGELEYVLEEDGTPLSGFKAKNGVVSSTGKSIEERPGLPETGGTSNAWYYGAGIGLVLMAGFILKKHKKEI